jgi:serine protease Do
MKYYASDAGDTLYFSIPINDVVEIADDIIANGKYSGDKGSASQGVQLGISGMTAVKGEAMRIDQTTTVTPEVDGVLIVAVNEGYVAYGKLEMFDIVISFDGVKTTTIEGLRAELFKHKVGDTVKLEVWRDGKVIEVELEL